MRKSFILRSLALLALVLPVAVFSAAVYKSVGPNGQVIYSDQARPGAKEIKIDPSPPPPAAPTTQAVAGQPDTDKKVQAPFTGYTQISITKPANEETVRENSGAVGVEITLEPVLQVEAGHKISVTLDGKALPETSATPNIQLSNVDRGAHSLEVSVLEADGAPLISSSAITFYMVRESSQLQQPTALPGDKTPPTKNPRLAPEAQQAPRLPSPPNQPKPPAPTPPPPAP